MLKKLIPFVDNADPNDWQIEYEFLEAVYKETQLKTTECSMESIEETILALLKVLQE